MNKCIYRDTIYEMISRNKITCVKNNLHIRKLIVVHTYIPSSNILHTFISHYILFEYGVHSTF